jgi:outer membrane protein assembly factor BamD
LLVCLSARFAVLLHAMKKNLVFLSVVVLSCMLFSCSREFNKVMKSSDVALKLEKAHEFYNKGQYEKAQPLFEEHLTMNKGIKNSEEVLFLYAYCFYYMKDYAMSSFYFRNFVTSYPSSKKAEEASFMMAKSYQMESPRYNLDQTNTFKAIEQYQTFVNRYPNSDRVKDANSAIDALREKLLKKAYENAYLYYKVKEYQAAAVALKALLKDYPGIDNPDRIHFYAVRSLKLFADNSANVKKLERYEAAAKEATLYREKYPNSNYIGQVNAIYEQSVQQIKLLENEQNTGKEKRRG